MLADCKQEYGWNVDPFDRLVGLEQPEIFLEELGSIKQGKNILIWLPNAQGNFSTRSAWECIRARALTTPWSNWIWHPALPKKISLLMWKAQNNCLPVDDRVRHARIPLVSK